MAYAGLQRGKTMIRKVTVRNFKRFREQVFELADAVVLAGPNNAGKSTLLQAIATWKMVLDRWTAQRAGGVAAKRSGVGTPRSDFTSVPLREMSLLWEDRKMSGPGGMSSGRRLIEIIVEGQTNGENWSCGVEIQYSSADLVHVRPLGAKDAAPVTISNFPPDAAKNLSVVHVPTLAGIAREEPLHQRGMQNLLVGQGQPGQILRNLLLEIANREKAVWQEFAGHIQRLFNLELIRPQYSPAQPFIICEYRTPQLSRPLDLANAGSGTLQVLLLFAFLYAQPAAVMLLDEPDAHQHVFLQKEVYALLKQVTRERGAQLVIATHSTEILDATEVGKVIGFTGATPHRLLHKSEHEQIREALKRLSTTELLHARETNAVLYLEGESDEMILREWAKILKHPAHKFLRRPLVHRIEGNDAAKARAHLFALHAVLPEIRALCLLDGDNNNRQDYKRSGMEVLHWQRYEIENYLLQPAAIKRFIGLPIMEAQVDAAFARQVPAGADLFGKHPALSRIKASEEFLPQLLHDAGAEIPKKDMYLLAAAMRPEEIHPEVVEKLDRIAATLMGQKP